MFSLFKYILNDTGEKKRKHYEEELKKIKKIEDRFQSEVVTIDQVQAKTHEFQARFSDFSIEKEEHIPLIKKELEVIKYEAFALHRRACELIY